MASTNFWDMTDPSKVKPPTVDYVQATAKWAELVERYVDTGELDQAWGDAVVFAGGDLVELVSSVIRLAVRWDNATDIMTGASHQVAKAFAEELYAAIGVQGR